MEYLRNPVFRTCGRHMIPVEQAPVCFLRWCSPGLIASGGDSDFFGKKIFSERASGSAPISGMNAFRFIRMADERFSEPIDSLFNKHSSVIQTGEGL